MLQRRPACDHELEPRDLFRTLYRGLIGQDRGPRFVVHEWHGDHLKRWRITAGDSTPTVLEDQPIPGDVLLREPEFRRRSGPTSNSAMQSVNAPSDTIAPRLKLADS